MPPKIDSREQLVLANKSSRQRKQDFNNARKWFPDRLNIVSEGGSWFAYPNDIGFKQRPSNLIAHITKWTRRKANFIYAGIQWGRGRKVQGQTTLLYNLNLNLRYPAITYV